MRVVLVWILLALSGGFCAAMLLAIYYKRKRGAVPGHLSAVIQYAWAMVPWLLLALDAAPAIHRVLGSATG